MVTVSEGFWVRSPDSEISFPVPSFISDNRHSPPYLSFFISNFLLSQKPALALAALDSSPSPATVPVMYSHFETDAVAEWAGGGVG